MNLPLLIAAILTLFIVTAHSYLGERYLLMRLFRRENLPELLGGVDFTKRTLRFAWHITSVLGAGFAAFLFIMASGGAADRVSSAAIIAITFAVCGLLSLTIARGRHLSWIVFFAIAALTWWGK